MGQRGHAPTHVVFSFRRGAPFNEALPYTPEKRACSARPWIPAQIMSWGASFSSSSHFVLHHSIVSGISRGRNHTPDRSSHLVLCCFVCCSSVSGILGTKVFISSSFSSSSTSSCYIVNHECDHPFRKSVCVCMCLSVCVCVYVCMYVCMCVCGRVCAYVFVFVCSPACINLDEQCMHECAYEYVHVPWRRFTCVWKCKPGGDACMRAYLLQN